MTEREQRRVPADELAHQDSQELRDVDEMSLIDANLAAPVNAAMAANMLVDEFVAYANAEQNVDIEDTT